MNIDAVYTRLGSDKSGENCIEVRRGNKESTRHVGSLPMIDHYDNAPVAYFEGNIFVGHGPWLWKTADSERWERVPLPLDEDYAGEVSALQVSADESGEPSLYIAQFDKVHKTSSRKGLETIFQLKREGQKKPFTMDFRQNIPSVNITDIAIDNAGKLFGLTDDGYIFGCGNEKVKQNIGSLAIYNNELVLAGQDVSGTEDGLVYKVWDAAENELARSPDYIWDIVSSRQGLFYVSNGLVRSHLNEKIIDDMFMRSATIIENEGGQNV